MADNQIDVKFGGDAGDAQKAIADVSQALKDGVGNMNTSLKMVMDRFAQFKGVIIGMTTLLAGGAMFKTAISAANSWNSEVMKISKATGETTQQSSVLAVALNHVGVSADTYTQAAMMLSRQVNSNAEAFKVLGVETKNTTTGAFRPISEIMADVNTRLGKITNTTQQNIAGMQVYGRSWAEIKAILKLTGDVMEWSEEDAKRLHLIVGPEGTAATKKYGEEQRDLQMIARSLEIQMGNALLPVMVKVGSWMGEEGPRMADIFTASLQSLVAVGQTIYHTFQEVGNALGALSAAAVTLASGNLAGAKMIMNDMVAQNEKTAAKVKEIWQHAYDKPSMGPGKAPAPGSDDPALPFKTAGSAGGGAEKDTRFAQWKNQLEQMKEAEGNFFKTDLSADEAYWQSKLQLVQGNGEKEQQIRRQVQHELFQTHKQMAVQRRTIDEEEIDRTKQRGTDEVALEEEKLRSMLALGQINDQQKITAELALASQEHQIDMAALDRKMTMYQQDQVAYAKLQTQKEQLIRAQTLKITKLEDEAAEKTKERMDQMLSPITSAISTSIQGMIQGTTTMKKALGNLFQSITASFVDMIANMTKKWLAEELAKTAITREHSIIRSALEAAGLIKTAAVTATTDAEKSATTIATSEAQIPAVAGLAAGEAASSVASIPYVGPALAAAAYAETYAMIMSGMAGFAVGSWKVPDDMFTKIHKGEMIVPAEFADNVRNGGGLGGGDTHHYHIHAVDAQSFERLLMNNSPAVSKAIRRQARNFTSTRT